ncbi:TPM domain-containing protein [Chelativorans salis]|uniref:TPM domain-containing protein n=1 Tax=Chelativorans salis TaxID=2978478 RepID=A0ABT2LPP3_9HYPH|nr:TPM domain-containing protein [Chelativorans sp. EGI FJ00035]MCT7376526.1 TPM domain-containing protein [Chelativorans sp. EGI FJ00035]
MANEHIFTDEERSRVVEAIGRAESRTSGEIYCVLARTSDSYFYPAAFFVALSILIVSLLAAFALHYWWVNIAPATLVAAELAALAAALLVLKASPGWRICFVPRGLRFRRAHAEALRQFFAHNIHMTRERTGVLIFVSLAEHYAEVVADAGINARVPQERWNETVAKLTEAAARGALAEGFVEAVEIVGTELAAHFPAGEENSNEIDNHLVEI